MDRHWPLEKPRAGRRRTLEMTVRRTWQTSELLCSVLHVSPLFILHWGPGACMCIATIQDELEAVEYARKYFAIGRESYKKI